jgi:hypothetical protein
MLMLALLPALTREFFFHILLIIGCVAIVFWLLQKGKIPEPFNIVGWVVLAALAIYLLFYLLG